MSEIKTPVATLEFNVIAVDGRIICMCPTEEDATQLAAALNEKGEIQAELNDNRRVVGEHYDALWGLIYPNKTNWGYPGQINGHIKATLEEKDTANAALKAENERLKGDLRKIGRRSWEHKKALEFYADPENYNEEHIPGSNFGDGFEYDDGQVARAALAGKDGQNETD